MINWHKYPHIGLTINLKTIFQEVISHTAHIKHEHGDDNWKQQSLYHLSRVMSKLHVVYEYRYVDSSFFIHYIVYILNWTYSLPLSCSCCYSCILLIFMHRMKRYSHSGNWWYSPSTHASPGPASAPLAALIAVFLVYQIISLTHYWWGYSVSF